MVCCVVCGGWGGEGGKGTHVSRWGCCVVVECLCSGGGECQDAGAYVGQTILLLIMSMLLPLQAAEASAPAGRHTRSLMVTDSDIARVISKV